MCDTIPDEIRAGSRPGGSLVIIHGGGPTPVLNASLYGAVREALRQPQIRSVYGAIGGVRGLLEDRLVDFRAVPERDLERLLVTPASAIGTARDPLSAEDYAAIVRKCSQLGIQWLLYNGGNGSMEACGRICAAAAGNGQSPLYVVGIPKTIDNDLAATDHAPGFGSAARYLATTTAEIGQDVRALPIHVCIIEAFGRNAGWIAAASALARRQPDDAPHLIYLPERPFDEEQFLKDVQALHEQLGGVVVVVSEGLKNRDGQPIVPPVFQVGRSVYYGDVSAYLVSLVIRRLGIKARSEKPGLCGRSSMAHVSPVDRAEAIEAGAAAVRAACSGHSGVMVAFERLAADGPGTPGAYASRTTLVPIEAAMLYERTLPDAYINAAGNDVTPAFVDWCRPLLGADLPDYISFRPWGR